MKRSLSLSTSTPFRVLVALFAVSISAVIGVGIFLIASPDETLRGATGAPPRDVSTLHFPNAIGQDVSFIPAQDNVALVFFGFTHCPDICPTTMSDIRTALTSIGSRANRVQVAMVTIDPGRDTAPILQEYVSKFITPPAGVALRTDNPTLLRQVATGFGASYKVTPTTSGEPDVVHSSWLYAVDDTGHIVAQWQFGVQPKDIAHDLKVLLS